MSDPNRVPEPISALISTFEAHLSDVEFPGVDARSLRAQASAVDAAADAVAAAETALREARAHHAEAYGAMKTSAVRGLGYARVYATDDPELTEALAAIDLQPARGRRKPPKKRARKPKAKPQPDNVAELPLAADRA